METCGLTRILVPAAVVGVLVSTLTASELAGWIAAILTAGVVFAIMRQTGDTGSCAAPADGQADDAADRPEPVFTVDEVLDDDAGELVDR